MINDDFHKAGIRQVVAERLMRVVMYSIALGPIPLIVLHSLVRSAFWFQQSLSIFSICTHIYGSGWLYSILAVQVRLGLFYGGHLVCSLRPVSLLV